MADKKISELDAISGSATASDDLFLIVDSSGSVTKKISREELNNAIEQDVLSTVDINGGTIDSTVIGGTTPAAGDFTTLGATGNITVGGTVDGRDVATDGSKLDGIAVSATANPNAIDNVVDDTTPQLGGDLDTNGNDVNFGDNDKAIFGSAQDLQIYHNGNDSVVRDAGTGDLLLAGTSNVKITTSGFGETMAKFTTNGAAELYHNNSAKLATTATGCDITGTVTADGLTVDGEARINTTSGKLTFVNDVGGWTQRMDAGDSSIYISSGVGSPVKRIKAQNNGDISFYADDGTTQGLFWDSSTQRLGLGTTSPSTALDVAGAVTADDVVISGANPTLTFFETDTTNLNTKFDNGGGDLYIQTVNDDGSSPKTRLLLDNATGDISFYDSTGVTQGLFWDASTQRLGLGTTSPDRALHVNTSQDYVAKFSSSDVGAAILLEDSNSTANYNRIGVTTHDMQFVTNNAEAMRIASGGNVGIGTSSPDTELHLSASDSATLRLESTDTTLVADQVVGAIEWESNESSVGSDGVVGKIDYIAEDTTPEYSMRFFTHDTSGGVPDFGERMRIDSSGNVGIGETSPDRKLHIKSSSVSGSSSDSGSLLVLERNSNNSIQINSSSSANGQIRFGDGDSNYRGALSYNHSSDALSFVSAGTERMRIDSSGNLLVGTSSTLGSFHASSAIQVTSSSQAISCKTTGGSVITPIASWQAASSGYLVYFTVGSGNANVGNISTNGSSTAYNTTSDYRLKENVTATWDATTRLKQLNPVRFNFIADADTTVDGFLAHEVQDVVPEAITGTKDEVEVWKDGEELPDGVSVGDNKLDEDGNTIPVMQGIDQSKLVPLLVKTIQELEARITALEAE